MKLLKARTCLLLIGVTTFVSAGAALAAQGNPGIAPINSNINYVKTYGELGAEWWQWVVQVPAADNPLLDTTGDKCGMGQQGPVWFLAGVSGTGGAARTCEVPGGKALFFPVVNVAFFAFPDDPPGQRTREFLTEQLMFCDKNTLADVVVRIDGVPVAKAAHFWTSPDQSPLFQATLPTDNIFGADPGQLLSPSLQEGVYLYVKPLTTGTHTVAWTASWNCGAQDISYTLTVLPGVAGQE